MCVEYWKINFKLYRTMQFHSRILMTILSCLFSSSMIQRKNIHVEDGFIIKTNEYTKVNKEYFICEFSVWYFHKKLVFHTKPGLIQKGTGR